MCFSSTIVNVSEFHLPFFWHAAERLLPYGQKKFKIIVIEGNNITLQAATIKTTSLSKILKVAACATLILPLLALVIKAHYRQQYLFEVKNIYEDISKLKDASLTKSEPAALQPDINPDIADRGLENSFKKEPAKEMFQEIPKVESMIATAYNIDDVIASIHEAQNGGKKTALFVGRLNTQSIPNEQDWAWFSLDYLEINKLENSPEQIRRNQSHLQINFNQISSMKKINHLFDKVVVDTAVMEGFSRDAWKKLHRLLVIKPESELIAESWSGKPSLTLTDVTYDPANATMILPINDCHEKYIDILLNKIEDYLKNIFVDVKLVRNSAYPYLEGNEAANCDFWIARGPKQLA